MQRRSEWNLRKSRQVPPQNLFEVYTFWADVSEYDENPDSFFASEPCNQIINLKPEDFAFAHSFDDIFGIGPVFSINVTNDSSFKGRFGFTLSRSSEPGQVLVARAPGFFRDDLQSAVYTKIDMAVSDIIKV